MNDLCPQLSVDLLRRIDAACDRFEESWRNGSKPRIEDYLALFKSEEQSSLLDGLQKLQHELILSKPISTDSGPMTAVMNVKDIEETFVTEVQQRATRSAKAAVNGQATARVTIDVIAGPHAGLEFTFEEHNTLFAGRLRDAQLRLEKDLHFSRHHFRLEVNPPTCFLMDLSSRNGTFVNGERIKDKFLVDGDVVSGGHTKMVVSIFDPESSKSKPVEVLRPQPELNPPPSQAVNPRVAIERRISPTTSKETSPSLMGYQIFEQIGAGDLGIVYRAKRLATQEDCAVKILSPAAHADENSIQAFLREASVLNQLEHPYIIRLLDMGAAGRSVFIATEYVASISWAQIVASSSPEKRIRVACGLMAQILGALEYAHARSLVHRDVKPGNLLIAKKDNKLQAKLADFGLAKQYTTAGMSQVTRDGDVLGSLPFMSPDQFLNSREARPTCDIYSAGASLYWMLTGHEPIPLEGHPCKFLAILESPPTPIRQYNSTIPESLAQLVHRALEKTAEKRFVSAAEMRQQLRAFLK